MLLKGSLDTSKEPQVLHYILEDKIFIVKGYVDSDFAGDLDKRKSTTSYVFTLVG